MTGEEDQPETAQEIEETRKLQNAVAHLMLERPGITLAQIFFDYRVIRHIGGGEVVAIDL